jgi:hypothetical protein
MLDLADTLSKLDDVTVSNIAENVNNLLGPNFSRCRCWRAK